MANSFLEIITSSEIGAGKDAVYFAPMDYVMYLVQDSAYVADRVDGYLTLLRDPQTRNPIGVKLKGFHHIYLNLKRLFAASGIDLEAKIPFRVFIALAETYACTLGKEVVEDREREFRFDAYEIARKIVGGVTVSISEMGFASAA